ncbi:MAG TPA: SpoIIE family protein phosphatase, partial [Solirubrobacterales bacterium]|nr:SpoIIE family protein phosphatase [Solirubrobacterales bacterium]
LGKKRFSELLAPGGRIYHETHYAPLLRMQGEAREIALEIVRADGSRLPALVNSVLVDGPEGEPQVIRTTVFDASDRRRYEEELLRARRREQEIAQQLQRSMLTGELPGGDGLEVSAGYRPAESGMDIGGDWYDSFWLDDGRIGLVVGDVVGRGIEAAAAMGQLRSAVRVLASTDLRPAALLEALDAYATRHGVGSMATLVYAELDPASRQLRFACAGHPPPAIVAPGDDPRLAWDGRSLPLGVRLNDSQRPEADCALEPGGLVLLYTDGVVERRGEIIDVGLERLLESLRAHREERPELLTANLLRALGGGEHRDDACLLAASLA